MRLMPRLASDMVTPFRPVLKKAIGCRILLSGSLRKATDPVSPAAPRLRLRELSSGRDNQTAVTISPIGCVKDHLQTRSEKSVALLEHTAGRLAQRANDFPIGCFRKCFQRARPDVSQHAQLQVETCRHRIVRRLVDRDDIIVAHGEEKVLELATHIFEGFLGRVQTTRRVLHFQRALVSPICEHDVCGHNCPPSGTRHYWYEAMGSTPLARKI